MNMASTDPSTRTESSYADWKGWKPGEFGFCAAPAQRYFRWHVERAFSGAVPAPLSVLEIGFGNGTFLGFCRSSAHTVSGIETDPELVARARAAGFDAVQDLEQLPPARQFDLIAAFDVLEHLDRGQLEHLFQRLPGLLKDGGRVLIRVPNGDSPFGGRHQHGDISHVSTFGEFKFRQLAHGCGLAVHAVGECPWNIDEFEAFTMKMMVRGLVRKLVDYLMSMAYYRERVDLSPNLVVVLRKPA